MRRLRRMNRFSKAGALRLPSRWLERSPEPFGVNKLRPYGSRLEAGCWIFRTTPGRRIFADGRSPRC
jgi:hypothetical protein